MSGYEMKPMGAAQVSEGPVYPPAAKSSTTGVRRIFSLSQMYFFSLSYMSSWEALATNIGLAFYNGGPRAMVWGFFIVIPGVLAQCASLAEMASMLPIAGGQYHWAWGLAPKRHRRFVTWMQGWITWFAWVSGLAGLVNVAANVTTSLVQASYPDYVLQNWHTVLVMYAYLLVLCLLGMYGFWLIPWIEFLAGLLHIALWVVFACVLLVLAPRHSAEFVFFEKSNMSGWDSDFVSFNLGIILITWGFIGYDAAAHISEETRKAPSVIPRAMFWSIFTNSFLAFGMVLIFFYCLGDIQDVLDASYPLMSIFLTATQSASGASALVGVFLLTIISCCIGSIASTSRLTWAWARDGALPAYFAYVDPKRRIPIRSVWLPVVIVMLLSLLNIAHETAFSVIIALTTFGIYQSYFIAICCMLYARLTRQIEVAPWSLGRWGVLINVSALFYTAWVGVFMVFPRYLPITAPLMNYALPINAFIWLLAIVFWFAWGRKNWKGLDAEVIDKVLADGYRDTKD